MTVSKRTRFEVLRRDGHRCRYCGATAADGARLTVDHVTPAALGGTDEPGNLVAACVDCNAGKASTSPDAATVAQVAADAVRWAAAMRQAAAEREQQADAKVAIEDEFKAMWNAWKPTPELGATWRTSIHGWMRSGLGMRDFEELIEVAMKKRAADTWPYFCGCCKRRLEQLRERAAAIIATEVTAPEPSAEGSEHDCAHGLGHESLSECAAFDESLARQRQCGIHPTNLVESCPLCMPMPIDFREGSVA